MCRRLESDIKQAGKQYVFTYMDMHMTPARVDAVRAHVANNYGHQTVAIVFNNGSFIGGSEAVYEIMKLRNDVGIVGNFASIRSN